MFSLSDYRNFIMAMVDQTTLIRTYAFQPNNPIKISKGDNGEILCQLARTCSQREQDVVFKAVHPFELAKMSQVKGSSIGPHSHWNQLKPARFAYWGNFWNNMPSKEDFLSRLTESAHFFLLFEYFRSKEVRSQATELHESKLNEFIRILDAVKKGNPLPEVEHFFSFKEGEYMAFRAPLMEHYTNGKEGMQRKATEFVAFIENDEEIKDDPFAQKFLEKLRVHQLGQPAVEVEMKAFQPK